MTIQGIMPNATARTETPTSGSTTGNSSQNSLGDMDTTFMNLLITELQSQDPTAPMDATQMVGQMISLNQLDQLISINQTLQTNSNPTSATGHAASAKGAN
ncbi:MAG TPA: flagellar hook capping FlgD N-terminal domain-containing protein [Candidatus Angelobacter sp.]|jgi:flagellar basal-body rod modification protein FlgD|nr:flagellar hook capping FlgD N-terminal domain-containing protein [Candidatus Angelobacter sp.]